LKISAGGQSGETLFLPAGFPSIDVLVDCPGETSIILFINDEEKTVVLEDGKGGFLLPLADGTQTLIQPRDRNDYCPAGEAILAIVVAASETNPK
jgi:hypothetical protein